MAKAGKIPPEVTSGDLAIFLNQSPQQLKKLTDEGVLVRERHGVYKFHESVRRFQKYREEVIAERYGAGDKAKAQGDLVSERAAITRMQREQMEGKLISKPDIIATITALWSAANTRLLAIPSKLAPRFATFRTPVQAEQAIAREISDAIREVRDWDVAAVRPSGAILGGRGRPRGSGRHRSTADADG